jgi:peptide/nickel transport system substrate-binding protein
MDPRATTRRDVLQWLGSATVASLLAACSQPAPSAPQAAPTAAPAPPVLATTAPAAAPATAASASTTVSAAPTAANASGTPTSVPQAQGKPGGTLRVGMIGDLGTLEGQQVTQASVNVSFLAFDRLIDYDEKLTPQPMLAESWDVSSDLTQFKLNLRKGVQFHTGREFTSDDVKYNLLRVRDPKLAGLVGAAATESAWFTSIDTTDKYTIVLKSDKPRPGAFDFFEYFNIQDKDTAEGPDARTKIVGTGPFTFVEWVQGDHFTFTRNKNYWQSGRPYLDGVSITVFKDASAQILQLEAGALDLADSPPVRDSARLRQDPQYTYLGTFIGGQYFCVFINTSVTPLDNKVVRQALDYALDRQRFADSVMLNLVGPARTCRGRRRPARPSRRRTTSMPSISIRPNRGCPVRVSVPSKSTSSITISPTPTKLPRWRSSIKPIWTRLASRRI